MPDNPGGLVYGTILVATLLAAESVKRQTYGRTVGAVAIALTLYWLANAYAAFTGERARTAEHFSLSGYRRAVGHEVAVVYGALGPLATLLICWAIGAGLGAAVSAAVWTAAGMIAATELAIGVRSELKGSELVVQTAVGVLLGLAIVLLRVLLH